LNSKFKINDKITETLVSIIYHGVYNSEPAVIKILKTENASSTDFAQFNREYNILKNLDIDGIIKILNVATVKNMPALILEDFGGISLKQYLAENKIDLKQFLTIAIKIAKILAQLHERKIIHADIKPSNIIINNDIVKITDFGISEVITHKNEQIYTPHVLNGTLPYMSPEQTGRINKNIDYRTDLYSLGITFYEMLSGKRPITSKDPLEIIHFHIAKKAIPLNEVDNNIPKLLSNIVEMLMAKNPEERYQNAMGLLADLEYALKNIDSINTLNDFEIAQKDISLNFNIPQTMVGRKQELEKLFSGFQNIQEGGFSLSVVSGNPGIGKSAVVSEIQRPILEKHGNFITGKYEKFRADVPYSSILQALNSFSMQILTESEENISWWKEQIKKAVGTNGKLVTDMLPEIIHLIGEQPPLEELNSEGAEKRALLVYSNFLQSISTKKHPLVLFLDDIQWADLASIKFIRFILENNDINYLYLILSYRDNEIERGSYQEEFINFLDTTDKSIIKIEVTPLTIEETTLFFSRFVRLKPENCLDIGKIIYGKTRGNPFFITQFIKKLYEDKQIFFSTEKGWQWNISNIQKMEVTDNVIEILADKITSLDKKLQDILIIGSCIGNRFDLGTLSTLSNKPIDEIIETVNLLIEEGLIAKTKNFYKFNHDRIMEAALTLTSKETASNLHYSIGKLFLANTPQDKLDNKINYIVNQLNAGSKKISSDEERLELIKLNIRAAEKAKKSAAYHSIKIYIEKAMKLLSKKIREDNNDLIIKIYELGLESSFLVGDYDKIDFFANFILKNSQDEMDITKVYKILMSAYMAQNKKNKAVATAIKGLKNFGIILPDTPSKLDNLKKLIKLKISLRGKDIETLKNLPICTDKHFIAINNFLLSYSPLAYWARATAVPYLVFIGLRLNIKFGLTAQTPYFFAGYGLVMAAMGKIEEGYNFALAGVNLLNRISAKEYTARSKFIYTTWLAHWKEPLRTLPNKLDAIYEEALEVGDFEFAAHAFMVKSYMLFHSGSNLSKINELITELIQKIKNLKQESQKNTTSIYLQAVKNLLGEADDSTKLKGDAFNEETMLPIYFREKDDFSLQQYYFYFMYINFHQKKIEEANKIAELTYKNTASAATSTVAYTQLVFYDTLIKFELLKKNDKNKKKYWKRIKKNLKKIKEWAKLSPENFEHKYNLLLAIDNQLKRNFSEAISLFDKAINGAKKQGIIQEEALANEYTAYFWEENSNKTYFKSHLKQAILCYQRWGAKVVVDRLKKIIPKDELFENSYVKNIDDTDSLGTTTTTKTSISDALDFSTIFKSAQAISGQIVLKDLLETLMQITAENAGAEKSLLFLYKENELYLEAMLNSDGTIKSLQSTPLSNCQDAPLRIIRYVQKTNENIILENATKDKRFSIDQYISSNKTKSIVCAPIKRHGKTTGIIYLENNLTEGAFSPDRLKVLRLLSAQAAISIENAILVNEREKNARLETEIALASKMQLGLLPNAPQISGYEIYGYMETADAVGGDYYDIINCQKSDWVIIGDVSGHGFSAGQIMNMVQTSIQTKLRDDNNENTTPSQLLEIVNRAVSYNIENIGEDKYVTITALKVEENGSVTHSGLHQDILIYRDKDNTVESIGTDGLWLGFSFDLNRNIENKTFVLNPGDLMFLYTDGITEARDKAGNLLDEKIVDFLKENGKKNLREIKDSMLEYMKNYTTDDDVTMFFIKRKK